MKSNIRLLLKHPKKGELPSGQARRICERIHALYSEHGDYDKLKVRCYEEEASLRGRKFDDKLLNIGWYTHERRSTSLKQIWGHSNRLISLRKDAPGYESLAVWFADVYRMLWDKGETLKDVCKDCSQKPEPTEEYEKWLSKVSKGMRK